ncbi:hypothetical protein DSO57_1025688 [Entomophthora muscae]|uniref:Uncharacterized protein n=1 Tax=Entomophthora muscae TaxID=34485 RepID=A0ACC2U064_9FUNG|nr:hypothetical protein DSO57_1025688 [Entomophthora muscae]
MLVASDPTVQVVFCGFPVVCLCCASEHNITNGKQVLKKVSAFYSKVPMPCVVAEPVELLPNSKKPKYHIILNTTCRTFIRLFKETQDYKNTAAIVVITAKTAHRLHNKYLKMGSVLLWEKSKRKPILLIKEHKWAILKWIN